MLAGEAKILKQLQGIGIDLQLILTFNRGVPEISLVWHREQPEHLSYGVAWLISILIIQK